MKILFSHYQLDDDNAPVRTIQAVSQQLRELGHEVHVHRSYGTVKPRPKPGAMRPDGGGPGLKPWLKGKVWFAKATARNRAMERNDLEALQQHRPDAVLVRHDAYNCSMAWAADRLGVPRVTYVDAPMAYETRTYFASGTRWHPPGLVEALERRALQGSRALTATSHPTAEKIREQYRVTMPIRIVPNGLHPERFPELAPADRLRRRSELGINAPMVAGFQGGFLPFHGIDRLRDLMLGLEHRRDLHWLLIGEGPERAMLEAAVAGRVPATFLGWQRPEQVGALTALMDIHVVPHRFVKGPFYLSPLKVIESAAAQCAVVAGAQGDIPWLLDDGRAGVVIDTPELEAWVAAIEGLLDDPGRCRDLGHAARQFVMGRFTWRHIAELYAEVLQGAVETGGRAAPEAAQAR